jgi:exopolyphosphatase/guanosine-5'-triphosphate,3'-diphosphate pyrophosphatase
MEERRLLKGAALLHEIGQFISFAEHHKHSYYLILHSDLPGLSASEKMIMALVARYHRKAHPSPRHEGYATLDAAAREVVRKLAAILRIADALDREQQSLVGEVRVQITPRIVHFRALTHYEAPIEIWNANQKATLFEEVFGRAPRFSLVHV